MGILAWIVLGLIAGAIAKAIMPGKDPGGMLVTMLIGIVGAFLGGFLGNMLTGSGLNGFSLWSILLAVVGALLLLWIYRMATRSRTTTTVCRRGATAARCTPAWPRSISSASSPFSAIYSGFMILLRSNARFTFI